MILLELIEPALLTGLLLLLGDFLKVHRIWLAPALLLGLLGGWWYAQSTTWISELWDFRGQELLNASMQVSVFGVFTLLLIALQRPSALRFALPYLMAMLLLPSLIQSLAEVWLYVTRFAGVDDATTQAHLAGSLTGLSIALSMTALLYAVLLWSLDASTGIRVVLGMLALLIAGMVLQAVSLLMQIDYLPEAARLWNSNTLIAEDSIMGQFLETLIGYEASPTLWHVLAYIGAIGVMIAMMSKIRKPYYE
jgi:high-affinity iron transporter